MISPIARFLHPCDDGTGLIARQVRLHLDMDKLSASDVAAQDVGVGCIATGDHGVITPAA